MTMTRMYLSSYDVYRKSLGHSLEALLYKGKLWKPCEVRARLYKQEFLCQVPGGCGEHTCGPSTWEAGEGGTSI